MTPEGAPCWIEIMAEDTVALKNFYAALFPSWEFKEATDEYKEDAIVMYTFKEPKGLSGGIMKFPEDKCGKRTEQTMGAGYTVYYYVESIEKTEAKVHELGGTTVLPKMEESKNGWFANFKDPQGNRFGVYEVREKECNKE